MPSLDAADAALSDPRGGSFAYRRDAHPNARSLAQKLAHVHGAESCVLTAQGMSGLAAVAWSCLKPGSEVWLARDLYGKTRSMFLQGLGQWQIFSRTFNPTDPEDLKRLAGGRADLVVIETISNPRLLVSDIAEIARITHGVGGKLLVDNTFASHLLVRPLELGADLCMESLTKIVSGHSDAMLGMVCGRDMALMQRIASAVSLYGLASSPLDCYLTARGLASLPLRLDAACRNAQALAEQLDSQATVERVDYPGLQQHPQHRLARTQLSAFGWMVCIEVRGGRAAVARAIERLSPEIPFCPSLGDIQTTVSHPASTSHRGLSVDELAALGISDGTLRISCGAEPTAWLCEKFTQALTLA
jgi:cystathionine beta-lyase/cystathionine gamma-synthase